MNTKPFKGSNVYISRNLVPPELFDAIHDALKLNGATVFLCCDPSRNSSHDFHVISSHHHEKFEDLRAKGCNLLGPQCVLSCAKERRSLPKLGYACCLAMDGVKVLASGFNTGEREKIAELVTAMSGSLLSKASTDVSFVIVKSVIASKYKWAASKQKHIVTINWLNQCWVEHRVVPLESYRVPPFLGLIISVSRIPVDERKVMEKLIIQNGGKYSAELTKLCTHLICEVPEGDKFIVAKKWGTTRIVNRKWFDQSIAKRVCLNEEAYPVQSGSISSVSGLRCKTVAKSCQDKNLRNSQSALSSAAADSSYEAVLSVGNMDFDMNVTFSQNVSSMDVSAFVKDDGARAPHLSENDNEPEGCIAADSETDDNDLYLSDCRICLVGFNASDMRKLVGMVRKGGGSRYMACSERLTHIVVGAPSDIEKRELRGLAAVGVIRVVKRNWLEDCDRAKKEVPVNQKHIAYDILLPKDSVPLSNKSSTPGMSSATAEPQSKLSSLSNGLTSAVITTGTEMSSKRSREDMLDIDRNASLSVDDTKRSTKSEKVYAEKSADTTQQRFQHSDRTQHGKSLKVFSGRLFRFSHSFPVDKSDEVVQWINEGGGEIIDSHLLTDVDFIVERHGVIPRPSRTSQSTYVSSHWVRTCLKDGCLLDVGSHILYSPLPCQTPLPGFEGLRFCVSQYVDNERLLLRNLCKTLGAKFSEKLTKNISHLLCKFANGPKYETARKRGVNCVTCEWLYECVRKNEFVALSNFFPAEVPQDPDSGLCTVTQYPTQAASLISMDYPSQLPSQSQDTRESNSDHSAKRLKLLELESGSNRDVRMDGNSTAVETHNKAKENGNGIPDVAAAIEDLLEQTSKIQDLKSPGGTSCEKSIFSSDCPILGRDHPSTHSALKPPTHWLRSLEKEDVKKASRDPSTGNHDFSETQTESQLVSYEEDLSGRQMIIDRVRSSMT